MNTPDSTTARQASLWRYQVALWFASVPVLCFTLWQALRYRQWRYLWQRLGFQAPRIPAPTLWLHAASVGEVLTAEALVKTLLSDKFLNTSQLRHLVITTVTPTGALMVKQRFTEQVNNGVLTHAYLPIDWRSAVQRFLKQIKPTCAMMMETELWPNLYATCAQQQLPLIIINGRLSSRTLQAPAWIRQLYYHSLQSVNAILARSPHDGERFCQLGAIAEKVTVVGNLKFSSAKQLTDISVITLPRPYVLAASTHEDEERQITQQWLTMNRSEELLVIAPRHPQRSAAILKQLQTLTPAIAVRSRNDTITADTRIYLADTLGELTGFMASAEVVIMGGSFAPVGGHNVLEPAMLGKAMLFGPHMHNFADESENLLAQQAALQLETIDQLPAALNQLLDNKAKRQTQGERAQLFMHNQGDVLEHYLIHITELCQIRRN